MNVHLDQDQAVTDAETDPTADVLRTAIQLGQPLAGYLPADELLRQFVRAVREVCHADVVHLFIGSGKTDLRLRARYTADSGLRLLDAPVEVDLVPEVYRANASRMIYSEDRADAVYYVPLRFNEFPMGVLRAEGKADTDVAAALDVLASFAACGLASTHAMHGNRVGGQYDKVNELIERTRLAAMSELAAAVSHQLNNPLTTILADTEILMLDTDRDTRAYHSLEAIARSGRRAAEVVRRLMAVSRPDKLDGVPQPVDVIKTIEDVLHLVRRYIEVGGNIQIVKRFGENVPSVWVIPDSLEDVWMNLLMNARDALLGQHGAEIGIEVRYDSNVAMVEVVIWDNGVGVPEPVLKTIFEPFYTTKSSVERMGLGLHTSKQIIESVDGTITVAQRDGGGTRFVVQLPVKER